MLLSLCWTHAPGPCALQAFSVCICVAQVQLFFMQICALRTDSICLFIRETRQSETANLQEWWYHIPYQNGVIVMFDCSVIAKPSSSLPSNLNRSPNPF